MKTVPNLDCDCRVEIFRKELADELLEGNPTLVLDCIDNTPTKLDLLEYCMSKNIQVVSASGAGCRQDPSQIEIDDIRFVPSIDPLGNNNKKKKKLNSEAILSL